MWYACIINCMVKKSRAIHYWESVTYLQTDAIGRTVKISLADEVLDGVEDFLEGGALRESCFEHGGVPGMVD